MASLELPLTALPSIGSAGEEWVRASLSLQLLHAVEAAAGLKPLDLRLVEGVVQGDTRFGAVRVLHHSRNRLRTKQREMCVVSAHL